MLVPFPVMFGFILITIAFGSLVQAQDDELMVSDNKTQCVSQMVQWCNGMQYPQQGAGMTMLSVTFQDPTGYYRAFCVSDMDGTNCTRNGMPWFSCSPDHTLTFKGKPLTESSTDVDEDICSTADKALNDLFVQNLSYNTTAMQKELESGMMSFFQQMAAMQDEIAEIQKMLMRFPSIFSPDFWGRSSGDTDPDSTTMTLDGPGPTTDQSNQIEKE